MPGSLDYEFERLTALAAAENMFKLGLFDQHDRDLVERFFRFPSGLVTTMSLVAGWGRKEF